MPMLELDAVDRLAVDELLKSVFLTPFAVAGFLETTYPQIAGQVNFTNRDTAVSDTWRLANNSGALDLILVEVARRFPDRPDARHLVLRLASHAKGWTMPIGAHGLAAADGLERLTSRGNPFMDITHFSRLFVQAERSVCQVRCGLGAGTGFLVGSNLVLTCYHVVEKHLSQEVPADQVEVRFDYRASVDGAAPADNLEWTAIDPAWKIRSAPYSQADISLVGDPAETELDYALLRLSADVGASIPTGGARPRGWFDISEDRQLPPEQDPIVIAQHPRDPARDPPAQLPLKLAWATPGFDRPNANGTRIAYRPSTDSGSSGSPVFDRQARVVALHHNRGQINAAATGLVENNRGIPLAKIRAHLDAEARALLVQPPGA